MSLELERNFYSGFHIDLNLIWLISGFLYNEGDNGLYINKIPKWVLMGVIKEVNLGEKGSRDWAEGDD